MSARGETSCFRDAGMNRCTLTDENPFEIYHGFGSHPVKSTERKEIEDNFKVYFGTKLQYAPRERGQSPNFDLDLYTE